jgi:hypothetical protein
VELIERGRANPRLGIAAIAAALLLIAWIAWAIYVTTENGANAGLGVVLAWPSLLVALALVASPFVGLYFLVRYLQGDQELDGEGPSDDELDEEEPDDEEPDEGEPDDDEPDEGDADEDEDQPEETDPDEEPDRTR